MSYAILAINPERGWEITYLWLDTIEIQSDSSLPQGLRITNIFNTMGGVSGSWYNLWCLLIALYLDTAMLLYQVKQHFKLL